MKEQLEVAGGGGDSRRRLTCVSIGHPATRRRNRSTRMKIKLDIKKLLGFRLGQDGKVGAKTGAKGGAKNAL